MRDPRVIVRKALLTEKGADQRESHNQYLFEVAKNANKIEIKAAIESLFDVHVEKVTTMIRHGKTKRFGRYEGTRPDWKRAIVTLKQGEEIELFDQV